MDKGKYGERKNIYKIYDSGENCKNNKTQVYGTI